MDKFADYLIRDIVICLEKLATDTDIDEGQKIELIEFLCDKQNGWIEDSVGYNVLESLKTFIRGFNHWTDSPGKIKENLS